MAIDESLKKLTKIFDQDVEITGTLEVGGSSASSVDIGNWNTAYGWGDHDGLYALVSHTHDYLYSQPTQLANTDLNNLTTSGVYFSNTNYSTNSNIPYANYFTLLNINNNDRQAQLWFGDTPGRAYWRPRQGTAGWHGWENIITSYNIGDYALTSFDITTQTDSKYLRSDADDVFTGNLTTGADNHITFGPNTTWGSSLRIGGNGRTATGTEMASVVTTDGNLHLDAANSSNGIYLNFYAGTNGTYFGDGAGNIVARLRSNGQLYYGSGTSSPYWHASNDGPGSGLNADLLDGFQATNFVRNDISQTISGNLSIGASDENYIAFRGTTGDAPGTFTHTFIGERIYGGTEQSELLLFKGNDYPSGSGPDRIRYLAAQHKFQIYNSGTNTSGLFGTIASETSNRVDTLTINNDTSVTIHGDLSVGNNITNVANIYPTGSTNSGRIYADEWGVKVGTTSGYIHFGPANSGWAHIYTNMPAFYFNKELYVNNQQVIHYGNIGSQSVNYATSAGNADTVDGYHAAQTYTSGGNAVGSFLGGHYSSGGTEKPNSATFGAGKLKIAMLSNSNLGFGNSWNDVLWISSYAGGDVKKSMALVSGKYNDTDLWIAKQNFDSTGWGTGYLIWNSGNDGSGSGLDADVVDGLHASQFLRSDVEALSTQRIKIRTGGLGLERNYNNNAIWWTGITDVNHVLWNDYTGGPTTRGAAGSGFDGMRWNTYRGLIIHGGSNGAYTLIDASNISSNTNTHTVKLYAYNDLKLETVNNGNDGVEIQRDLYIGGSTGGSYGNQLVIGSVDQNIPYTIQDANIRPIMSMTGQYPVVHLNHTVTSNTNHGPTVQFTFNGSNARQWVFGATGTGDALDIGYSDSGYGNTNYNPHNGIAGYTGKTYMRFHNNGNIGLNGDWGGLGSNGSTPSYPVHIIGKAYSSDQFAAPKIVAGADGFNALQGVAQFKGDVTMNRGNIIRWANNAGGTGEYIYSKSSSPYDVTIHSGSSDALQCPNTGEVRINYQGAQKFVTTASGVSITGSVTASGDVVAYSDERTKEDIKTIDDPIGKIVSMRGVFYTKKNTKEKGLGVIAQEIEKILPEVVKEDENGIKAVAYGNIVGVLIEAIKEQQKQIDELKAMIK